MEILSTYQDCMNFVLILVLGFGIFVSVVSSMIWIFKKAMARMEYSFSERLEQGRKEI